MFALGIFGILQVLFFPGILIRKFVKLPDNFFFALSSIIALSLISNYVIVFFLTALHVFLHWVVLLLFAVEIITIVYLYRNELLHTQIGPAVIDLWNQIIQSIKALFPKIREDESGFFLVIKSVLTLVSFIIGLIAIEWISRFFRSNVGEVFNTWDAVVSWNRWAVSWASNQFPLKTEDYPQLIPTNWALIYNFIGNSQIQFFSKAIMPIFPLLILLLILGLGLETKNPAFFLAIELVRLFMKKFSGEFISAGYVDFSLTFFVLLAFILLFLAYNAETETSRNQYIFLSLIFGSGSIVTKQPGFFAFFMILFILLVFIYKKDIFEIFRNNKKNILLLGGLIGIIIIPWYFFKGIQIITGIENTHLLGALEHTNQVHNNQSMFSNLVPGLKSLGNYLYIILFLIPFLFFINKFWRIVAIFVTLPYIALWASYASYDPRNLTMMYPFIGILFCLGLFGFIFWLLRIILRIPFQKFPVYSIFLILTIIVIALNFVFKDDLLFKTEIQKQKLIFSPELNEKLYDYFSKSKIEGKILTNYPVDFLPGFENTQKAIKFDDLQTLKFNIEEGETFYILYPSHLSGELQEFIQFLITQKELEEVFKTESWIPYTFAIIR